MQNHKVITRQQIAEALGVSYQTVWNWSAKSDFPAPSALGTERHHRILMHTVEPVCDWLAENKKATPTQLKDLAKRGFCASIAREVLA